MSTRQAEEKPTVEGCSPHHFILEEATGPTSMGTCKKCGFTKPMKNWSVLDQTWNALDQIWPRWWDLSSWQYPMSVYQYRAPVIAY